MAIEIPIKEIEEHNIPDMYHTYNIDHGHVIQYCYIVPAVRMFLDD